MSQSLAFLLIGLATLVGFYDLWAFVSVFRSDRSVNSKALWSLLIAVLPVLGVLIWAVAGPRSSFWVVKDSSAICAIARMLW